MDETASSDGDLQRGSVRPVGPRSNEERIKRVRRKADPWRRRVARFVIQLAALGLVVGGGVVAVRAVLDARNRIDPPSTSPFSGGIRSTTIDLALRAPTPTGVPGDTLVAGMVTVDTETGAFEFDGRPLGPQDGLEIAGRLGVATVVRSAATPGGWIPAAGSGFEVDVERVVSAVQAVADATDVNEILADPVGERYVTLLDAERSDTASSDTASSDTGSPLGMTTRYDLSIDATRFANDFPLRWFAFRTGAVPGARSTEPLEVAVEVTDDGLLVAVDTLVWSWRRLTVSDEPFVTDALLPAVGTSPIRAACAAADGSAYWETTYASCQEALDAARPIADATGAGTALLDAGTPGSDVGAAIDATVARLCAAMGDPERLTPVAPWEVAFGRALVDGAVCPGDPTVLTP